MVVERPYEYFTIFDFYRDGERLYPDDIQHFRRTLNQLLVKERPEQPNQPGTFLLLRKEVARQKRLQTLLRIADRLVSNGFKDEFNWALERKHDQVCWWTDSLALMEGILCLKEIRGITVSLPNLTILSKILQINYFFDFVFNLRRRFHPVDEKT